MLKTPVVVLTRGERNKIISEETRTLTVNAHGALVLLSLKVEVGQLITLHNSRTEEEARCRVVYISPHQAQKREVCIDFLEPQPRFWLISFLPADWTPKSPEAKGNTSRYSPSTSAKKKK